MRNMMYFIEYRFVKEKLGFLFAKNVVKSIKKSLNIDMAVLGKVTGTRLCPLINVNIDQNT